MRLNMKLGPVCWSILRRVSGHLSGRLSPARDRLKLCRQRRIEPLDAADDSSVSIGDQDSGLVHDRKRIEARNRYWTCNTIFPSTCPASRRLCASAASASEYSAPTGTRSFAASTALFSRSNSWMPEMKL